jgi:NADH dehydrogenase [ubiquinone] 1 alpha subcomplex assembly factor 6
MARSGLTFGAGTGSGRQTPALVGDGAVLHCAKTVEAHDYDGYACTLALHPHHRRQAFAFKALNIELAQVLASAKKPSLALMRFRWWRDALSKLGLGSQSGADSVPAHPVARALDHSLGTALISDTRPLLLNSVAAREDDAHLGADGVAQPPACDWLEAYGERAYGSLLAAQLACAGLRTQAAEDAASHVGAAQGIASLLAGLPEHLQSSRCYLPQDVCAQHGVSPDSLTNSRHGGEDAVREVVALADKRLNAARSLRKHLPQPARKMLLPAVGVGMSLSAIRRQRYNVFNAKPPGSMSKAFQLAVASTLGRY